MTTISRSIDGPLRDKIQAALGRAGLSFESLLAMAGEVVLFGSCAAGCQRATSDVDLLAIGAGKSIRRVDLHLLWVRPECARQVAWWHGELGTHVARYGLWLKSERAGLTAFAPSALAVKQKRERILGRSRMLLGRWDEFTGDFRRRQSLRLRRDFQRLALLQDGKAVEPTPALDAAWAALEQPESWAASSFSSKCKTREAAQALLRLLRGAPDQSMRGK